MKYHISEINGLGALEKNALKESDQDKLLDF